MKSHIPINRKMQEELCSSVWDDIERSINTNGALLVIALARYTGWRKKRLEAFIRECNEVQKEYRGYEVDGTFDIEFEKEIKSLGLDADQLVPEPIDFMTGIRNRKREREEHERKATHVSKATAEAMRHNLENYKNYMESLKTTNIKGDEKNAKA